MKITGLQVSQVIRFNSRLLDYLEENVNCVKITKHLIRKQELVTI